MSLRKQLEGFPLWQMLVVSMIRFSEPISFTSLFPYVYFMIRDFHIAKDPSDISRFTGYLAASFAFSQFLCCIHWGRLSDRIGRKPIILIGLCGGGASLLVFGFAKNFYVALAARSIAGALNGNVAVLQTIVGELVTERRHQAIAFASLPLWWNVGCVIGPLIGGSRYLTRPKAHELDVLAPLGDSFYERFITQHPYALSNIVVATMLFSSALIGFLFLEETHHRARKRYDIGLATGDRLRRLFGFQISKRPWEQANDVVVDETTPLRPQLYASVSTDSEASSIDEPPAGFVTRRSLMAMIRRYSLAYSLQPSISTAAPSEMEETKYLFREFRNREIFSYKVIGTILAYFLIAFHSLIYTEFVPVFLAGNYNADELLFPWHIRGGLGWQTPEIGKLLSTVGLVGCFMVIVVFPQLDRHVRTINGFRVACCMFPIAYAILPYIIFITPMYSPDLPEWFYKVVLYGNSMVAVFGSSLAFPQIVILVYRATKPKHRGLVNATSMSANSFARFVAPMTWGALTSYFDAKGLAQVPWNILAGLAVLLLVLSFRIDEYEEDLG